MSSRVMANPFGKPGAAHLHHLKLVVQLACYPHSQRAIGQSRQRLARRDDHLFALDQGAFRALAQPPFA